MNATMLPDERSFAFQASLLIACIVMCLDPIDDLAPIANNLSYHITLEGIDFAYWMMPPGLGLVVQCPSIKTLSDVKWSTIRSAQNIDVISP